MANVLLTWELGGGLGHLINLRPLAVHLSRAGHRVFVALKDLSRARSVFGDAELRYLQAPTQTRKVSEQIDPVRTFADLLHNVGFNDELSLRTSVEAWRHLYDYVKPDLVVFDHSPTALLAARGLQTRRALVGTGFFCPPPEPKLPDMRMDLPADREQLERRAAVMVDRMNRVLRPLGAAPLETVAQLYSEVDEHFLATFAELDHYARRHNGRYWGAWPNGVGQRFQWPDGEGPKIYAYLKSFAALEGLLAALARRRYPTVVYVDNIAPAVQQRYASDRLHFKQQPLDLAQVGQECDLAILNGNHGTTASMLLAGKPTLQLPLALEQIVFTEAVVRLGAGLRGSVSDLTALDRALDQVLSSTKYRAAAVQFATKYRSFDAEQQVERMIERAEELIRIHPMPQRRPVVRAIDPRELLHPNRFDLLAKYIYAKHRKVDAQRSWATKLYLDHIQVMNNFHEDLPRKCTPQDFLQAFDDLLDSVEAHGYDAAHPPVPVGNDLGLLNGAHRVAACLIYNQPVRYEIRDRPGYDFSAAWFRRKSRHATKGLATQWADTMALEYCRLRPDAQLVLVADEAELRDKLVAELSTRGCIVYGRQFALNQEHVQIISAVLASGQLGLENRPLNGFSTSWRSLVVFVWQSKHPIGQSDDENTNGADWAPVGSVVLPPGDATMRLSELFFNQYRNKPVDSLREMQLGIEPNERTENTSPSASPADRGRITDEALCERYGGNP
jgi:UDP:flavonoid glycosyltransferase YjiC (YdhE family)